MNSCSGLLSRRSFLELGSISALSLGLSDFLRLRSLAASGAPLGIPNSQDKAVIFVWLPGGPSQLDTYDMKPDAPSEFRGD
ncbi:MAG: DUF1501 domain-containing protein, partial [Limisphaerales bacterium]